MRYSDVINHRRMNFVRGVLVCPSGSGVSRCAVHRLCSRADRGPRVLRAAARSGEPLIPSSSMEPARQSPTARQAASRTSLCSIWAAIGHPTFSSCLAHQGRNVCEMGAPRQGQSFQHPPDFRRQAGPGSRADRGPSRADRLQKVSRTPASVILPSIC